MMSDDMTLVREFAQSNSEKAFTTLVSRHINLVYSVALRHVRDPHMAEEITQGVFILFARKAKSLNPKTIISGWLGRTARYVSADTLKIQRRRQFREQESHMQSILNESDSEVWTQIAPLLDEALDCLGEKEHNAIVLRFFEGKDLKQVGASLGMREDAARMRVNRAVEKLRKFFARKGVTLSASAIAGAVSANSVQAAPVGLAAAVAAAAFSGTTIATATITAATKAMAMTTLQKILVPATVAVLAVAGVYEARQAAQMRDAVRTLRQQQAPLLEQIQQLQGERDESAHQLASLREENERLTHATGELLRLRGEVGRLRRQSDELKLLRDHNAQLGAPQPDASASKGSAHPPAVAKILITHVKQPQEVGEEQIRTNISIKVGDIFDQTAVARDVRTLYSTGLFHNLRVADNTTDEGVTLNYLVQENPRISQIRFAGNSKFTEVELAKLLSSSADKPSDERTLSNDAQKIQDLYVQSGLSGAKVKYVFNVDEAVGAGEVIFEIAE
ncbi:putative RNA polymerase, sigma 70 family subunit [Pedosphaera parvula Ellin514]|uniref:Putative RNA polymerase, sigma 70 family subunit n=2 Tax=Pedosphaera TaxID=1032526 RepID=B9XC37_PEDPL|nr:putative RNA polymerase, sigma 70 family subunit [Pedosphaera parvula Ellin514]